MKLVKQRVKKAVELYLSVTASCSTLQNMLQSLPYPNLLIFIFKGSQLKLSICTFTVHSQRTWKNHCTSKTVKSSKGVKNPWPVEHHLTSWDVMEVTNYADGEACYRLPVTSSDQRPKFPDSWERKIAPNRIMLSCRVHPQLRNMMNRSCDEQLTFKVKMSCLLGWCAV